MQDGHEKTHPPASAGGRPNRLSVDEAIPLFAEAGVPRSPRQIRRYCQRGDIDCIKLETQQFEKYSLDRESTERWLVQLQQAAQTKSRPDTSGPDRTRQAPTGRDQEEIEFLRTQINQKDRQIEALLERDKETNILIHGLQNLVLALQPPASENRGEAAIERPRQSNNSAVDNPYIDLENDQVQ